MAAKYHQTYETKTSSYESGTRVTDKEPFCGKYSSLNPSYIYLCCSDSQREIDVFQNPYVSCIFMSKNMYICIYVYMYIYDMYYLNQHYHINMYFYCKISTERMDYVHTCRIPRQYQNVCGFQCVYPAKSEYTCML